MELQKSRVEGKEKEGTCVAAKEITILVMSELK
jgi:hypothetical protein